MNPGPNNFIEAYQDISALLSAAEGMAGGERPYFSSNPLASLLGSMPNFSPWQLLQSLLEERAKNMVLTNALLASSRVQNCQQAKPQEVFLSGKEIQQPPEPLKEPPSESYSPESSESSEYLSEEEEVRKVNSRPKGSRKHSFRRRRHKNQTKNIPKNFGKAIANFIEKNQPLTLRVLQRFPGIDYAHFILDIRQRRKVFSSIADLRSLWLDGDNPFAAPARILSLMFLRKHSLPYIFHSRVTNFEGHVKYRLRLIRAICNPEEFTHIKEF